MSHATKTPVITGTIILSGRRFSVSCQGSVGAPGEEQTARAVCPQHRGHPRCRSMRGFDRVLRHSSGGSARPRCLCPSGMEQARRAGMCLWDGGNNWACPRPQLLQPSVSHLEMKALSDAVCLSPGGLQSTRIRRRGYIKVLIVSTLHRHAGSNLGLILFMEVRAELNWPGSHLSPDTISGGS